MVDINQQLFQQLAQFLKPRTSETDIAKMILSKSTTGLGELPDYTKKAISTPVSSGKQGGGPSALSRIIDIVSRPLYSLAEGQRNANNKWRESENQLAKQYHMKPKNPVSTDGTDKNVLGGMVEGFTGKKKTTFSDVLKEEGRLPKNKAAAFGVGLGADILFDPTTYLGPGAIKGAYKGAKALMGLKTEKALDDASKVSIALEQTTKDAATAEHGLSPMQASQVMMDKVKDANVFVRASTDGSVAAEKTFNDLMKGVLYTRRGNVEQALLKDSRAIEARVSAKPVKGNVSGKFVKTSAPTFSKVISDTTRALNTHLDEPIRTLKIGETVSEKSVTQGIMARVATWQGQKDLRPMALDATTSGRANAEKRIAALQNTLDGHADDVVMDAVSVMTKAKPHEIVSEEVSRLADQLTGSMEVFFKSSAITDTAAKANSVAMRSGAAMNDVNHMLKKYGVDFQFTAGKTMHPQTFKEIDYSKGTDWLNSWENAQFKDPQEFKKFLFGMQSSMEQLTKEYAFVDDVAERFGYVKPKPGYKRVDHARLGKVYFPKEMADQLSTSLNTMHDFYNPKSPVMKFIAGGTSVWKAAVTKYYPSHHVRNVIGDTWLAWMAGVNNPLVFKKSIQVMKSQRGKYSDLENVDALVGPNALSNSMEKAGATAVKNKSGTKFTNDQIYIAAHNFGLLQSVSAVEDIMKPGMLNDLPKPFGGKISNAVGKISESREHFVKLAHFIDVVHKSKGKDYKEIFESAAHEVRKWHPDGLDLTKEEQKLRMLIPFYSWSRKSIPLIIEGAVMNPSKAFLVPAKAQYNLQQMLGIEGTTLSNPYPSDQLFPDWMKEKNIPVLGKTGMPGLAGLIGGLGTQGINPDTGEKVGGYTLGGPTNPLQDMFAQFSGGLGGSIVPNLNPAVKIPMEVLMNKDSFTGAPVSNDKADYITKQLPGLSNSARIAGMLKPSRAEPGFNMEGAINQALATNIQGSAPYIENAKFDMIGNQQEQNKKYREFANQIGYPIPKKKKIPQFIKDLYEQQQGSK